jgi:hypothetical protein
VIITLGEAPTYGPPLALASAAAKAGQRKIALKKRAAGVSGPAKRVAEAAIGAELAPGSSPASQLRWLWLGGILILIVGLYYVSRGKKGSRGPLAE